MNFYKGTKIEKLDPNDENIYLSDEALDYIYKMEDEIDVSIDALDKINRYGDTLLENSELREIIEIFESVIDSEIFEGYIDDENTIDDVECVLEMLLEAEEEFLNIIILND